MANAPDASQAPRMTLRALFSLLVVAQEASVIPRLSALGHR